MRSIFTRSFFIILFLACLLNSGKALTLSHENQYFGQNFNYDYLKIFSWNMGSDYCKSGETYPNCDSYIKESVDKLISMGDKYDILCLQEVPKFDRSQQKATADKFINDFVLKYKYAIFRKEGTNIAILSKFPIQNQDEIQLSMQYGAQMIQFKAAGQLYKVANILNAPLASIASLETRKQDIRKTLRWMNSSPADFNILAGDFNMNYGDIDSAIQDVNPFELKEVPSRSCPWNGECIYAWKEPGWSFTIEQMSSEHIQFGASYSKSFLMSESVLSNLAVTIYSNRNSSLDIFGNKNSGADLQAQLTAQDNPYDKFILQPSGSAYSYLIVSPYDKVKYLRIDANQPRTSISDTKYFPVYWTTDYKKASSFKPDVDDTYDTSSLKGLGCPSQCYLALQQISDGNGTRIVIAGAETQNPNGLKPNVFYRLI